MADSFWTWAARRPDHVAVIEPDGRTTTARDLVRRINSFSHLVRSRGIAERSRVAVLVGNRREYFETVLGAQQVGVHAVPINTHLSADEIAYIVQDCDAELIVVDDALADTAAAALDQIDYPVERRIGLGPLAVAIAKAHPYEDLLAAEPDTLPDDRLWGHTMLYTSGTTGRPKGVYTPVTAGVTPEEAIDRTEAIMARRGMWTDPDAVSLVTGPLYHGAPGSWGLMGLHHGHQVVLAGKWDSERTLQLIEQHRVTTAQMAPIHFHRLLQLPDEVRERYDHSTLEVVTHAGSACPVETKQAMMAWWGPVLYEYYASSEGYGTSITPQDWLDHPGSVGRADGDGATMMVTDDAGKPLPAGEVGTLWIRNPGGYVSEYLNDPVKTRASHRDGYYTAGDQASIDADGWLYIADRRTDLILSGGVNIYPAEVERALSTHPAVAEVAVVGVPDPEWGQRVHAVVVAARGAEASTELADELRAHATGSLARFKVPRTIEFRADLPYSPTGKLLRRVILAEHTPGDQAVEIGALDSAATSGSGTRPV